MTEPPRDAAAPAPEEARDLTLPSGVLAVRRGPGANCSSAGSAVDVLFYGSVIVGALAIALAAAFAPRPETPANGGDDEEPSAARGNGDRSPPLG